MGQKIPNLFFRTWGLVSTLVGSLISPSLDFFTSVSEFICNEVSFDFPTGVVGDSFNILLLLTGILLWGEGEEPNGVEISFSSVFTSLATGFCYITGLSILFLSFLTTLDRLSTFFFHLSSARFLKSLPLNFFWTRMKEFMSLIPRSLAKTFFYLISSTIREI